ncbi:hypothetical protein [Mucilaginibacter sp.]
MSSELDLKALWNKQPVDAQPDIKQLIIKAERLKYLFRTKLIFLNVVLLLTIAITIYANSTITNEWLISKIGAVLMILAYISYLIAYNQMIPLLFKVKPEISNQEYLNQLITINRKSAFLDTVMTNIYFVLLSAGLFLFLVQPFTHMTRISGIAFYAITFLCMAFAWLYLKPISIKRRQKHFNDVIAKLEAVNRQLSEK